MFAVVSLLGTVCLQANFKQDRVFVLLCHVFHKTETLASQRTHAIGFTGTNKEYFGEQESQAESNAALAANLPLTFFLMFVTLLFLFRSYRKPIVILLMLPLIFIGIVLGLVVFGKSFDFFSILGLLGLIGMNIKNAIVLVDQIDTETAAGKAPREAVISATTTRIVPVAMASGTTILGMLPLLSDAMFGGMAATIMGGLLVASALTLFALPVAYCAIHKIK